MAEDAKKPLAGIDLAFRDLMLEIEHQIRRAGGRYYGSISVELVYQAGELHFHRVKTDTTVKSTVDKPKGNNRI